MTKICGKCENCIFKLRKGDPISANVGLSVCRSVGRSVGPWKKFLFFSIAPSLIKGKDEEGARRRKDPSLLKSPKSHRGGGQEEEGPHPQILESPQPQRQGRRLVGGQYDESPQPHGGEQDGKRPGRRGGYDPLASSRSRMERGPGGRGPLLSSKGQDKKVEEGAKRRRAPCLIKEDKEGSPRLLESPKPHRGGGR